MVLKTCDDFQVIHTFKCVSYICLKGAFLNELQKGIGYI